MLEGHLCYIAIRKKLLCHTQIQFIKFCDRKILGNNHSQNNLLENKSRGCYFGWDMHLNLFLSHVKRFEDFIRVIIFLFLTLKNWRCYTRWDVLT